MKGSQAAPPEAPQVLHESPAEAAQLRRDYEGQYVFLNGEEFSLRAGDGRPVVSDGVVTYPEVIFIDSTPFSPDYFDGSEEEELGLIDLKKLAAHPKAIQAGLDLEALTKILEQSPDFQRPPDTSKGERYRFQHGIIPMWVFKGYERRKVEKMRSDRELAAMERGEEYEASYGGRLS